jgi:MYXO-CTERM domain-containing protein
MGFVDPGPRIALAILLAAGLAVGWRRRREVRALRDRAGFVAVAVASAAVLASLFEPEGVAWSRVGIPLWLRLAGFPVGAFALARAGHRGPGRTALLFGTACALLASSWVVVLMVLRGWAIAGLRGESVSAGPRGPAPSSIVPRAVAGHQS